MDEFIGAGWDETLVNNLTTIVYIVASIIFILGLKRLASPATARTGNRMAAVAMLMAVLVTLISRDILRIEWIIVGVITGSIIGVALARRIQMTAMPQLVAVFNGFGGAASALIAAAELVRLNNAGADISVDTSITVIASTVIGAVTLTGSFIAFGKLQGLVAARPVMLPVRNYINAVLVLVAIGLAAWLVIEPDNTYAFVALILIALSLPVPLIREAGRRALVHERGALPDLPVLPAQRRHDDVGVSVAVHVARGVDRDPHLAGGHAAVDGPCRQRLYP